MKGSSQVANVLPFIPDYQVSNPHPLPASAYGINYVPDSSKINQNQIAFGV
jgi:hypothetical protein